MSDFEKKILEFKNRLNNTQDSKEIESIRADISVKMDLLILSLKNLVLYLKMRKKLLHQI